MCDYTDKDFSGIIHRASVFLDVALLPKIFIISQPQFPNCKKASKVSVEVNCIIYNSTEPYTVTWDPTGSYVNPGKLQRCFVLYYAHTYGFTHTNKTICLQKNIKHIFLL